MSLDKQRVNGARGRPGRELREAALDLSRTDWRSSSTPRPRTNTMDPSDFGDTGPIRLLVPVAVLSLEGPHRILAEADPLLLVRLAVVPYEVLGVRPERVGVVVEPVVRARLERAGALCIHDA